MNPTGGGHRVDINGESGWRLGGELGNVFSRQEMVAGIPLRLFTNNSKLIGSLLNHLEI
jgi:hypothetical protein